MSDLSLADAFSVLPVAELAEITEKANELAEACRAGSDAYSKSWGIVFSYVAGCAEFAMVQQGLEISNA